MRRLVAVHHELAEPRSDSLQDRNSSIRSVTLELLHSGQPRAYADELWEGVLTFSVPEGQLWAGGFPSTPEQVKPYVNLMLHGFVDKLAGEKWEWHQPWLKELERLGVPDERPIRWRAVVIGPYLD